MRSEYRWIERWHGVELGYLQYFILGNTMVCNEQSIDIFGFELFLSKRNYIYFLAFCISYWWRIQKYHTSIAKILKVYPLHIISLWPSDAIWWQWTGSTLTQVMACCLTAPSHSWTNVDFSSVRFCGIHLRVLSWVDLKIPISKTRLKFELLKSYSNSVGTNALTHSYVNVFDLSVNNSLASWKEFFVADVSCLTFFPPDPLSRCKMEWSPPMRSMKTVCTRQNGPRLTPGSSRPSALMAD